MRWSRSVAGSASDTAKAIAIVLAEGGEIAEHASRFEPPDRFMPKKLREPQAADHRGADDGFGRRSDGGARRARSASGVKLLFSDTKLAARVIILDPEANLEVPISLMATTGMNAFAHCAEGPVLAHAQSDLRGAGAAGRAPAVAGDPGDGHVSPTNIEHRAAMLVGANLSGMVLVNARVGIHHAMCHCLGGLGGLPHGVANAIMLPHAMALTGRRQCRVAKLAEAIGAGSSGTGDPVRKPRSMRSCNPGGAQGAATVA